MSPRCAKRGWPQLPDPVAAALLAEKAGANGITVHLREDRRHIQEHDVRRLLERGETKVNLEMAVTPAMVRFAEKHGPMTLASCRRNARS